MNVSSKAMNSNNAYKSSTEVDIETTQTTVQSSNESESNIVILNGPTTSSSPPPSAVAAVETVNESETLEIDDERDQEIAAVDITPGDSSDESGDEGICDVTDHVEFYKYPAATSSTSFTYIGNPDASSVNLYSQPRIKVAVVDEFPMIEESKSESDEVSSMNEEDFEENDHQNMRKISTSDVSSNEMVLSADDSRSSDDSSSQQEKTLVHQSSFEDSDATNKLESDDDLLVIPDDETCEKIAEQVEFYFSDRSLLRDAFLLKHVRRNKEGFVSLKLVSSFKRVRNLCKDWRVVGVAIKKKSKEIELNDLGTKIRRKTPLPSYDETLPSRTIVATNLPLEKLSIEKVSELFSKCGEIALIRILRPDCPIPSDVKHFVSKHPELQQNECALIEFTESSAARKALDMESVTVLELVLPKKKTGKKANYITKIVETMKYNNSGSRESERLRGGDYIDGGAIHNQSIGFAPRRSSTSGLNENDSTAIKMCHQIRAKHQAETQQNRRKMNVCSPTPFAANRKYSNCSDGFSSNCSEPYSRRQSYSSEYQRHLSYCLDMEKHSPTARRSSLACSDVCSCGATRKMSAFSNDSSYRRFSNGSISSDYSRKFSTASSSDDRKYSIPMSTTDCRRISFPNDHNNHRIIPLNTYNKYNRRYSSGTTDQLTMLARKNSVNRYDYYENGRKVSTDSGYDRRTSINSTTTDIDEISISRKGSLLYNNDNFIRKPIGPDDLEGKGFDFSMRTRKFGIAESSSVTS